MTVTWPTPYYALGPAHRTLRIDTQDERLDDTPMGLYRFTTEATVSGPNGEDPWRFVPGDLLECEVR